MSNTSKYFPLIFAFIPFLTGQVPVTEETTVQEPPPAQPEVLDSTGLGSGIFSDPEELANIEGLEDPMERLKVRDHDANPVTPEQALGYDNVVGSNRQTQKNTKLARRPWQSAGAVEKEVRQLGKVK